MIVFNIWYYFAFLTSTLITVLFFLPVLTVVRVSSSKRNTIKALRKIISFYGKICIALAKPYIKVRYTDKSEIHESASKIYVCNHRSSSDPFLMACLPDELIQVVNIWPFKLPILGPLARLAGYLSVREMVYEDFELRVCALLEQGVSVVVFPEGTRSGNRTMGNFHGAIFRVCLKAKIPIIPVCLMGNEDKPKRGSILLQPGTIHIHSLPPITADEYGQMTSFKLKNHVRNVIMKHINNEEGGDETD